MLKVIIREDLYQLDVHSRANLHCRQKTLISWDTSSSLCVLFWQEKMGNVFRRSPPPPPPEPTCSCKSPSKCSRTSAHTHIHTYYRYNKTRFFIWLTVCVLVMERGWREIKGGWVYAVICFLFPTLHLNFHHYPFLLHRSYLLLT